MAEYNMPQYILREFKVTDARVGFLCQLCSQRCSDIMILRRFHSIHNVGDRGVLQAMWEELAGKVGHRYQQSLSANHAYLKTLY